MVPSTHVHVVRMLTEQDIYHVFNNVSPPLDHETIACTPRSLCYSCLAILPYNSNFSLRYGTVRQTALLPHLAGIQKDAIDLLIYRPHLRDTSQKQYYKVRFIAIG